MLMFLDFVVVVVVKVNNGISTVILKLIFCYVLKSLHSVYECVSTWCRVSTYTHTLANQYCLGNEMFIELFEY